jgi:hypothetical protein
MLTAYVLDSRVNNQIEYRETDSVWACEENYEQCRVSQG